MKKTCAEQSQMQGNGIPQGAKPKIPATGGTSSAAVDRGAC
jgi:hypothetical protein